MGLFGKKSGTKRRMQQIRQSFMLSFEKAVEDHQGYKVIYVYNEDVGTMKTCWLI